MDLRMFLGLATAQRRTNAAIEPLMKDDDGIALHSGRWTSGCEYHFQD